MAAAANSYYSSIIVLIFLILIQLTINLNLCLAATPIHHHHHPAISGRNNTRFIKSSCRATLYPNLCFATFSRYATRIRGDPKLLANTALSLAFNATRSTTKAFVGLSKRHGLRRRDAAALHDCVEQLSDSIGELKDSVSELSPPRGGKDFGLRMSDIETWVSAALTNEDSCMDGLVGKARRRSLKSRVRRRVVKVARLTSIALAFVNHYAAAAH